MTTQDRFVESRAPDWREFENLVGTDRALHRLAPEQISRAAALYRAICADLMRARAAGYAADVVAHLDALTARGHNALYSAPPYRWAAVSELVLARFPQTLRRYSRALAAAVALFLLPAVLGFVGTLRSRAFGASVLPAGQAEHIDDYEFGKDRSAALSTAAAGFYVNNNVGVAFRCFATGILFGLGSVFFLVYNGLMLGAVAALVTRAGHGMNLLTFVCGHGAFELTAIVISGTAGLVMGYALVETGGRTRFASLRARAGDLAALVFGAALMLVVAAFIEGFWSPSGISPVIKRAVAAVLYLLVFSYLALAGRGRDGTGQR